MPPLPTTDVKPLFDYDVVTLGETMLRLTPPNFKRIEQATSLEVEVGGSESNTAVGLARLGVRVAWLSRLTNNPPGHLIANTLRGYGVDVSQVQWTEQDRVGLYFFEEGQAPRASQVSYDRAHSAFSQITPPDLPLELFQPQHARLLHLTGISLAVSASAAQTTLSAARLAKEAGWRVSFDLNYRQKLWTTEQARLGCAEVAKLADIVFAPLRDVVALYQLPASATAQNALEHLAQHYPQADIVLTLGGEGAIGRSRAGNIARQPAFELASEPVGRLGAGDAFLAGFLAAYLANLEQPATDDELWLNQALRWGNAAAAIKYTIPGDLPLFNQAEVARLAELTPHRHTVIR